MPALKNLLNGYLIQAKDNHGNSIIKTAIIAQRLNILKFLMSQFGSFIDRQVKKNFFLNELKIYRYDIKRTEYDIKYNKNSSLLLKR